MLPEVRGLDRFRTHFVLYRIIDPELSIELSGSIREDLWQFLTLMSGETALDLKALGLRHTSLEEVIGNLWVI